MPGIESKANRMEQNGHGHQNGWAAASTFLASLQSALSAGDADKAASYFNQSDSAWRDVLAMTGPGMTVSTYEGTDGIKAMLETHLPKSGFSGLQLAEGRTPPRRVKRAGKDCLECVVSFSTTHGNGFGILRLVESAGHWTGWTISLILHELHGFEEQKGQRKAGPGDYSRDFGAANWLDRRNEARAYKDRDPTVIVVGGGQAGLSAAARLSQLGLDTLIVDPEARVGDNWRNRYHSLTLHNEVHVNHLPFLPFPPTFPVFIPKDMLANWFEAYVQILELNFWTSTTLVSGGWDEKEGCWTVALERKVDGRVERRTMKPRHLVFATGVSGSPIIPDDSLLPGISSFAGTTIHSSTYVSGHQFKGKNALVIGSGNSAHDVAQDLYSSGAQVTMIQRSPTHVVSVQEAQRVYSVYTEGIPIDDCDLIALASPLKVAMEGYKMATSASKEADRELLEALEKVGFETSDGVDGTGFQPL
jgi:putative flavoprotein involved in K+ transport